MSFSDNLKKIGALDGPVLITGHSGFKGTWLSLLMEQLNIEIAGLSLPPEPGSLFERLNRKGLIREEFSDIRDYDKTLKIFNSLKPQAVIHMAAQPLVLESYKRPRDTFDINVMGTANILEASINCGTTQSVLVITTDKVYRNTNEARKFIEIDPLEGSDPYSASKVGTESVVNSYNKVSSRCQGPIISSVRAGNVIGGGDWAKDRLVPDLVRGFSGNEEITIRNGLSTRPWQHVLDPLHGYLLTLDNMLRGNDFGPINFGPREESITVKELVSIAQKVWPRATNVKFGNTPNTEEAEALDLDSSKASAMLGWTPKWNQVTAIEKTFDWWQKVLVRNASPLAASMADIEELIN